MGQAGEETAPVQKSEGIAVLTLSRKMAVGPLGQKMDMICIYIFSARIATVPLDYRKLKIHLCIRFLQIGFFCPLPPMGSALENNILFLRKTVCFLYLK